MVREDATAPESSEDENRIETAEPGDVFSASGNGGLALADFGGDLGAYLDAVVVPLVDPLSGSFVYLESVGFGCSGLGQQQQDSQREEQSPQGLLSVVAAIRASTSVCVGS